MDEYGHPHAVAPPPRPDGVVGRVLRDIADEPAQTGRGQIRVRAPARDPIRLERAVGDDELRPQPRVVRDLARVVLRVDVVRPPRLRTVLGQRGDGVLLHQPEEAGHAGPALEVGRLEEPAEILLALRQRPARAEHAEFQRGSLVHPRFWSKPSILPPSTAVWCARKLCAATGTMSGDFRRSSPPGIPMAPPWTAPSHPMPRPGRACTCSGAGASGWAQCQHRYPSTLSNEWFSW